MTTPGKTGREHRYQVQVEWTGARGVGTAGYAAYGRDHRITAAGKPALAGSADASFRGDPSCWNPEELLLASLSACHQLAYLHLCAEAGIVVMAYRDEAEAVMRQSGAGGAFESATLRPCVTIAAGDAAMAEQLHHEASRRCFIAASVNFPVHHAPRIVQAEAVG